MKIIYVDLETFRISMSRDPDNERQARIETNMFDLASDNEIENAWLYIPTGHRYLDPTTGYAYTGEATVPINNAERYVVRETREVMNNVRAENDRIKAENERLKSENEALKSELNAFKENQHITNDMSEERMTVMEDAFAELCEVIFNG